MKLIIVILHGYFKLFNTWKSGKETVQFINQMQKTDRERSEKTKRIRSVCTEVKVNNSLNGIRHTWTVYGDKI
jgi:hypothetical protein